MDLFQCQGLTPLWRAKTVITTGIIRPLRIAKIGRAAGECVGLNRLPNGIGKIRAGFHHDGDVSCPRDDEAESVCLHAKAGFVV
jgi:hypothetical protein